MHRYLCDESMIACGACAPVKASNPPKWYLGQAWFMQDPTTE